MPQYPSLEELIKAKKTGGVGETIQSGLEGFLAGRKRKNDENTARAEEAIKRAKQALEQSTEGRLQAEQTAGLITPQEFRTKTTETAATPEKIKALNPQGKKPIIRTGPNGELLQIDPDTYETTALTGQRTAQVPAGEASNLGEGAALEGLITQIEDQYKKNPSLVGRKAVVERAKLNPAVGVASALTGADSLKSDPEASAFLRNLSSLKTLRSFSLGGKQLTPTEVEQLAKAVPSEFRPETFSSDMERFKQEVTRILQARQQSLQQAGFRNVPTGNQPAPAAAPRPTSKSGLTPEQRRARIAELQARQAQGQ